MRAVRLSGDGTGKRDLYRKPLPGGREVYALRLDRTWRVLGDMSSMSVLDAMDLARKATSATPAPTLRHAPVPTARETSVDAALGLVLRRPDAGPAVYVQMGKRADGSPRERVLCTSRLGTDAARQLASRPWPE